LSVVCVLFAVVVCYDMVVGGFGGCVGGVDVDDGGVVGVTHCVDVFDVIVVGVGVVVF